MHGLAGWVKCLEVEDLVQATRDLSLGHYRKHDIDSIRVVEHMDAATFFNDYMHPNIPVTVGNAITKEWPAIKEWVGNDGGPDLQAIADQVGHTAEVPVADCEHVVDGSHCKMTMTMGEYLEYWLARRSGVSREHRLLYLKDWHLANHMPHSRFYATPDIFLEDWMNPADGNSVEDDHRFVYIGPKGSFTPLHADVMRSYSWSANVAGRKHWTFIRPDQVRYLRNARGNLPHDLRDVDRSQYVNMDRVQPIEVIQHPGQAIFVPSGWYHQVVNMDDTISINHNWANACNVDMMWDHLGEELLAVQAEIMEYRDSMDDWAGHCQTLLQSLAGYNYLSFYRWLQPHVEYYTMLLDTKDVSAIERAWAVYCLSVVSPVLAAMHKESPDKHPDLAGLREAIAARLHAQNSTNGT